MTVNRTTNRFIWVLATLLYCVALVACSKNPPAASGAQSASAMAESPGDAADASRGYRSGENENPKSSASIVPRGKPGASVSLVGNQIYTLEPGVAKEITLKLETAYVVGAAHVSVSVSEGLTIVSGVSEYNFLLAADTDYAIPLTLLATGNGRYYVHLHVNVETSARRTFKALSAIVQVGPEEEKQQSARRAMKLDGETPTSLLPAEEAIIVD